MSIELVISKLIWYKVGLYYNSNIQSTIHATLSSLLGLLGIYTGNYEYYNQLIYILSMGYFVADCYSKKISKDLFFHHLITMFVIHKMVILYPKSSVLCRGILLEISTPFLNEFKRTKNLYWGYGLLITFPIFRLFWLPWIYYDFIKYDDPFIVDYIKWLVNVFILLNWYWYYRISQIAISYL